LYGQDDFSIARALEEIKKGIGDQATLAIGTDNLEGRDLTPDRLSTVCETMPFLTGKRLVIVNGLIGRFEPPTRSRRQRRTTRVVEHQDEHKPFSDCMAKIPDSTVLVLVDGVVTSANPLFKELTLKATVKSFPLLRDSQLREWIQRRVADQGGKISPKAVQLLARIVGSNLWIMASEIDKLILFASNRRIEEADIKALVGYTQQATIFSVVDAILEPKAEMAEQLLQNLFQSGVAPTYILFMLSRQVQLIVRARELKNQKRPNIDIQTRLGFSSEYALRRTLEQASRYSLARLREIYYHLLETDLSIKTGKYDAELALNILVAELCQQGKANPVRPGSRQV
jgi:DNA polymerase-3 subunit delta